jgi:autoinducer 2-degrading protein
MYVVIVEVHVLADKVDEFLRSTRDNHEGTLAEPGNRRFDVLERNDDDPTRFVLYEVYEDEAAFAKHQQTPHYLAWRDAVAGLMAEPRQSRKFHSRFPEVWR